MITVIMNTKVRDFDTWLTSVEDYTKERNRFGFNNPRILRATDDPNRCTVILDCPNQNALNTWWKEWNQPQMIEKAGIVGQPTVTSYETVQPIHH